MNIENQLATKLTSKSFFFNKINIMIFRHRPILGQCLSAFSSCFPIAFLESQFNHNNKLSVLAKSSDQSVQVQGFF